MTDIYLVSNNKRTLTTEEGGKEVTSMPVMDKSSGVRNILSGKTAKTNADSISGGFGQFMKQSNASGTERSEAVEIKDDNPKMKVKDSSDSSRADAVRERMD